MKKNRILSIIFAIIIMVAVGVIIYSIYQIKIAEQQYKQVDDTNNEIINIAVKDNKKVDEEDNKEEKEKELVIDWDRLKQINRDISAWINVPDTNINYPILQGKDNEKYLKHDIYGNYSIGGCIFVNSEIKKPFQCNNTIIYGHNLKNGAMFSNLTKYSDKEYMKTHRKMDIYLDNGTKNEYRVFAYSKVKYDNKEIYNYSVDNLEDYYNQIKKNSQIYLSEDIDYDNPIITLSTCTNNDKQERYIVHAYLVR